MRWFESSYPCHLQSQHRISGAFLVLEKNAMLKFEHSIFLFNCAEDDEVVPPLNNIRYANALRRNGVDMELHIYNKGGHGFGIGKKLTSSAHYWNQACENWLKDKNLLE